MKYLVNVGESYWVLFISIFSSDLATQNADDVSMRSECRKRRKIQYLFTLLRARYVCCFTIFFYIDLA